MPKRWRTLQTGSFTWIVEEKQGDKWVEIARRPQDLDSEEETEEEIKELRKAKRRDSKGNDHDD
jgi:hypothetical protein